MHIGLPASHDAAKGEAPVVTTHEFCLFVDGADLTAASTVKRLKCAGYSHVAGAPSAGVQALVFSCRATLLADAVCAAVAAAERIPELRVARNALSGAVAVFDPESLQPTTACMVAEPTGLAGTPQEWADRRSAEPEGADTWRSINRSIR